ncbi:MAG: hypothetical protein ACD_43C00242G0001 [uncultured bacterium]|nr:MAG: hypothetical protein ACD_43C00242G0001 [uncultured bacterium]
MGYITDIVLYNARRVYALNLYVRNDPDNTERKIIRIRNVGERPIDIISVRVVVFGEDHIARFNDGNLSLIQDEEKTLRIYSPYQSSESKTVRDIDLGILQRNLKDPIYAKIVYRPIRSIFNKNEQFTIDKYLTVKRKGRK